MWLSNSSVGRKVVMSVTGIALILFLTFHCAMNVVALISPSGYNWICEMLGANWYAVVATMALACLFIIHLVYAFWLTWQNRKARGNERYAVTDKPKTVEWASQNMLVLGIIVVLGLCLHLFNFWAKMMLPEWHYRFAGAEQCYQWYLSHQANFQQCDLCGTLPDLDLRPVVPPHSRFLERFADPWLEQPYLARSLEMHRQYLHHHHMWLLCPGSYRILC